MRSFYKQTLTLRLVIPIRITFNGCSSRPSYPPWQKRDEDGIRQAARARGNAEQERLVLGDFLKLDIIKSWVVFPKRPRGGINTPS